MKKTIKKIENQIIVSSIILLVLLTTFVMMFSTSAEKPYLSENIEYGAYENRTEETSAETTIEKAKEEIETKAQTEIGKQENTKQKQAENDKTTQEKTNKPETTVKTTTTKPSVLKPASIPAPSSSRYFDTIDAAAIDFVLRYNAVSISSKREYGAVIIPVEIEGKEVYTYPDPAIGPVRTGRWGVVYIIWDKNTVAYVHTHGQYVADSNNNFSKTDKSIAHEDKVFAYVGTPSGVVRKYNPWDKSDVIIFRNAPFDPNYPNKK